MIKSVKSKHEVSTSAIAFLTINLVLMFGLYAYASITNFKGLYDQYTSLINLESASNEMIKIYVVQKSNLIFLTINNFIFPVTYLVTSVHALVFKLQENEKELIR